VHFDVQRVGVVPFDPGGVALPTVPDQVRRDETEDMTQKRSHLIIICGLPGAGKTTLAMKLAPTRRAVRFSPDEWMEQLGIDIWDATARERIETRQWILTQELLATGTVNVIIEWGTWAHSERDLLRERGQQLGAAVELHYLEASPEELWDRVVARGLEVRAGSRTMTHADLIDSCAVFEPPSDSELALYDEAEVRRGSVR